MQVQVVEKPLKYGTRLYGIGELIKMTDKHARLFLAIGRVCKPKPPRADIPASPSVPVTVVESAEPAPEAPRRRQYRRRDVRPQNRDPQAED
jgi:hypothetical protein